MGDLLGSPRVTPFYQLPPVQYPSTSQIVTPQGRDRGFMRGFGQASARLPPASGEVEVRLECSLSLSRMRRHLMPLW